MQSGRGRAGRVAGAILVAVGVLVSVVTAPGLPAPSFPLSPALAGAVRIHLIVTPAGSSEPVDFYGSGWTRACVPSGREFRLTIATAGHVLDLADLADILHARGMTAVKVVIAYRDGRQYFTGRDALRVDRAHDYGEVHVTSPVARPVIPLGDASALRPGDDLTSVACPGGIPFGVFRGSLVLRAGFPMADMPADSWLAGMVGIGPGASGAPVLDAQGHVVATVEGLVTWHWGGRLVVIVPISQAIKFGGAS